LTPASAAQCSPKLAAANPGTRRYRKTRPPWAPCLLGLGRSSGSGFSTTAFMVKNCSCGLLRVPTHATMLVSRLTYGQGGCSTLFHTFYVVKGERTGQLEQQTQETTQGHY
jgi:hypothetical protein